MVAPATAPAIPLLCKFKHSNILFHLFCILFISRSIYILYLITIKPVGSPPWVWVMGLPQGTHELTHEKTHTHQAGTGSWWVQVWVTKKYLQVTHAVHYQCPQPSSIRSSTAVISVVDFALPSLVFRLPHRYRKTCNVPKMGNAGTGTVWDFGTLQHTVYLYYGVVGIHG